MIDIDLILTILRLLLGAGDSDTCLAYTVTHDHGKLMAALYQHTTSPLTILGDVLIGGSVDVEVGAPATCERLSGGD